MKRQHVKYQKHFPVIFNNNQCSKSFESVCLLHSHVQPITAQALRGGGIINCNGPSVTKSLSEMGEISKERAQKAGGCYGRL